MSTLCLPALAASAANGTAGGNSFYHEEHEVHEDQKNSFPFVVFVLFVVDLESLLGKPSQTDSTFPSQCVAVSRSDIMQNSKISCLLTLPNNL